MKYLLIIILAFQTTFLDKKPSKRDSIDYYINASKKKKFSLEEKKKMLNKACFLLKKKEEDNVKCTYLNTISYRFYELADSIRFEKLNKETLSLALKLNDSLNIAYTNWNYADYYNEKEMYTKSYDYYNKAFQYFENLNKTYESARMLYAMAFIKGRYKDYQASESLVFKSIKKFKLINNNKFLYSSYNNLGHIHLDIKEYDRAIFYYEKSLTFYNKTENIKKKYLSTYNNIANTYVEKKQYSKALEFYNKDFKTNISDDDYARILSNRAYCRLLMKDTLGIKNDFFKGLKIRDSLNNKAGVVNSKLYISDYYKYAKDTIKAIKYAREANIVSRKIKNGGDYLKTLKQLANLDIKNSKKYLDRYITFNDSLITTERRAQNKFTRIEFETDEYIEEAEKLTQQNLLITISSIGTILVLSLLYFIRVQRGNNEKLRLEAEQQKANEEVYILTLEQQAKLEEERVNERNRISAELHDGVLGKLFGTRVNLGFLGMQMNTTTQEKHQIFLDELQTIEKEIRDVSHKLSDNFDDASINFATILKQLLKEKSIIGSFEYEFKQEKIDWKKINQITKANVYRIIQEALQNIIKHAKAKKVILDVSIVNQNLVMTLKDDGVGFDMKKSKKGIGLKNIKSRLKKLHGTLELVSEINKGTTLIINSPYNTNEQ